MLVLTTQITLSQESSFFTPSDSLNKKRLIAVSSSIGATWAGSTTLLWNVWYKDSEITQWHTFDDSRNWLQMDKAGHTYTAYHINRLTHDLFTWSGVNNTNSTLIGAGISIGYQSTVEFFDGKSQDWGFSWSDITANTIGTGLYTSQQLIWKEQRLIPKFSVHLTEFAAIRPQVLGSTFTERILKDYNGQTYWLSFSPGSFWKESGIPKWACLSFGYSINNKLVGDVEFVVSSNGNNYQSQREFLFSLDIDFSQFEIRRKWLKAVVNQFNYLKIPFPTIMLRDNIVYFRPLYF